jgi:enoyl-CoA hydratase/carnithine racemase
METTKDFLLEQDGLIRTIIINRPEKRNMLTAEALLELKRTLDAFSVEDSGRVVVIRGAGDKAFCAGYDITALPTSPSPELVRSLKETPPLEQALQAIRNFPYPVIAMINGHAFGGGCELAMGCDIRIAAKRVKMGMPPAKLGIVYPYTGYRRFLTVLGFTTTLEIFLTGRQYDSGACLRKGLVNEVVEDNQLEAFTYDLAREISENAPLSLKGTKSALYKIAEYPHLEQAEEDAIRALFARSIQSEDLKEGKRAFKERRKPAFKGK